MKNVVRVFTGAVLSILLAGALFSGDRSPEWSKARQAFKAKYPYCAVCGTAKDVQIHHIKPFHMFPELELDETNLIPLCISKYWGFNCHLRIGHGGNFRWYNPDLLADIKAVKDIRAKYVLADELCLAEMAAYLDTVKARVKAYTRTLAEDDEIDEEL